MHRGLGLSFVPSSSKPEADQAASKPKTLHVSIPKKTALKTVDPFTKNNARAGFGAGAGDALSTFMSAGANSPFTPSSGVAGATSASVSGASKPKPAFTASGAPKKVNYSMFTNAASKDSVQVKEIGVWEKHTKGIGMKLMSAMGYKPGQGLGPASQGIAVPIDVKVRKKGQALQEENERTEQSKKQFPTEDADAEDRKFQQQLQQWRVEPGQRKRRPKYEYKTAEELAKEMNLAGGAGVSPLPSAARVKVVDMTKAQPKVMSGYEELGEAMRGTAHHLPVLASADGSVPMPELQHNLNQLVEMAATDIQRINNRLQREQNTVNGLSHDREEIALRALKEAESIKNLKQVIELVEQCIAKSASLTLTECIKTFQLLRTHFNEEYVLFGLDSLAPAFVYPLIKRALSTWKPLEQPDGCGAVLTPWRELLHDPNVASHRLSVGPGGILSMVSGNGTHQSMHSDQAMDFYERMCWEIVMPILRTVLSTIWDVRNPSSAIRLMLALPQWLPGWVIDNIREQLLIPRLLHEVEQWDPRRDTVPIHTWITPWLQLMERELQLLFPPIRFRLATCLQAWHPSDRSALAIIKPWRNVWSSSDLAIFLSRTVVSKLTQAVQEMSIDPQHPQLDALSWVAAWRPMLLLSDTVSIFKNGFTQRFLSLLCEWLNAPTANYEDISNWYRSWKSQFDEELLSQPPIKVNLAQEWMVAQCWL